MGDGSGGHPGYQTPRIVLSISLVDMYRTLQPSRRVDPCSPYSLLLPTGSLGDRFLKFEAELFPCARHSSCQLFRLSLTLSPTPLALPHGLSAHATLRARLGSFFALLHASYFDKADYWDSPPTWPRAHFNQHRMAADDDGYIGQMG